MATGFRLMNVVSAMLVLALALLLVSHVPLTAGRLIHKMNVPEYYETRGESCSVLLKQYFGGKQLRFAALNNGRRCKDPVAKGTVIRVQ
ncbi:unnamed protein product [Closterium sp. NIES-53]